MLLKGMTASCVPCIDGCGVHRDFVVAWLMVEAVLTCTAWKLIGCIAVRNIDL